MFAALFQMLPVIAGVTLDSPIKKANILQYPFIIGIISLLFAFNFFQNWLFILASILLGGSIIYIIIVMLLNLVEIENHSISSKGMLYSIISLCFVIILALYLLGGLVGVVSPEHYIHIKVSHYSFGLFGWISLLIISISFQVIEMFYVTPSYPKIISKYLPISIIIILLFSTIVGFYTTKFITITNILIAIILSFYALLTLKRLTQRKRPLTDATVWFWRIGLSSLLLSMFFMISAEFIEIQGINTLSYIFFASFAISIVFAMFYKIIPFLTWFHLNSQGYLTAPMMHEIVHPKTAIKHLYIHLATIISFLLTMVFSKFIFLAGILTIISFSLMTYQIIHAHIIYKKTQETEEKFEM
jgi:MFS family permease